MAINLRTVYKVNVEEEHGDIQSAFSRAREIISNYPDAVVEIFGPDFSTQVYLDRTTVAA